jgi:vacuolar protein sorting-associated protein 29
MDEVSIFVYVFYRIISDEYNV